MTRMNTDEERRRQTKGEGTTDVTDDTDEKRRRRMQRAGFDIRVHPCHPWLKNFLLQFTPSPLRPEARYWLSLVRTNRCAAGAPGRFPLMPR